jgi:hypothetical protein
MYGGVVAEIDVLGIPIPDAGPVFLTALAIHVTAAAACVIAGATAALSRKGGSRHVAAGRTYVWGLAVVFATMTLMSVLRWRQDRHLFAIGALALSAGLIGYVDRRRRRNTTSTGADTVHIAAMGSSYVALLTAFYVDNGPNLPLWDLLPHWTYWTLPGLIGLPLITRAMRRRARPGRPGGPPFAAGPGRHRP